MQCKYGLNEEIYYFDTDENKYVKFRCPYDSLANVQVCKFHDNTYSTSNRAIFEEDFSNLVNESETENKRLSCIGFYFPPDFKFPDIRSVTYFNYCKFGKVSFDEARFYQYHFYTEWT